jgi:L-malate glycosyltransferase
LFRGRWRASGAVPEEEGFASARDQAIMIRVLFIARYHDVTASRKLWLLAREPDLRIVHICPRVWRDVLGQVVQQSGANEPFERIAVSMIGRPADPHRTLYRTLSFAMRRFRPDIVHAEEEPDSLSALQIAAARRLFAPRARLLLNSWQNVNRPKHWTVRWVLDTTLHASDAVLCASRAAVQVLREEGYGGEMLVLPAIGVDLQTFVPCTANRSSGEGRRGFTVGYLGRLVPEKSLNTLIAAIGQLRAEGRDLSLQIVGDGPQRPVLETLVQSANLAGCVRFIAALPPAQVARQMCELDAVALPSRGTPVWQEQFGRVLVEAMACRVPVVGSDSGAIPEVIGDAGLIFPEGDAQALAAQLRRLIESPALCAELADRGRERAAGLFSQERIAARTAEFYRQLMEPQG